MANRLAAEASPYLRQHAENPVDWYPWGAEAFARARAEDRPVLCSVGYSACHWCHVMAHESFENPDLAALINRDYVAVKVDREEHPDVDAIYQTVCQWATGQGGWPLTVFLTPDGEPFHVGTYFPPTARFGRPGLAEVLGGVAKAWRDDRDGVLAVAREWTDALRRVEAGPPPAAGPSPGRDAVRRAAQDLAGQVDPLHGGFGDAPKFPHPEALELMLRAGGHPAERAVFTLRAMASGGIYDHLGGGFHRYSVDAAWQVPHFEKMLYDNALLTPLYLAAHQCTGEAEFARVAAETADHLLRDMRAPEGGFYSTLDADSAGPDGRSAEGAFYTWTPEDIEAAVGAGELAELACRHFGVTPRGNFEGGRTVLHLQALSLEGAELARIEAASNAMLLHRERRPPPSLDDKVLAGWNGLAIAALSRAGRILDVPRYTAAAAAAAAFVLEALGATDGGLRRRWRQGRAGIAGTLEDYAYMAMGLCDLYEATLEPRWLGEAARLARQAVRRFWDAAAGAFFLTEQGRADLIQRPRDEGDSGTPSGQSWAVQALLRLRPYLPDPECTEIPDAVLARNAELMRTHPRDTGSLLCAADLAAGGALEVVMALPAEAPIPKEWLAGLRGRYLPNLALSRVAPAVPGLDVRPPAWEGREPVDGRPTLYVCRGAACLPPAQRWAEVAEGLRTDAL